jgi:hypothetical protein
MRDRRGSHIHGSSVVHAMLTSQLNFFSKFFPKGARFIYSAAQAGKQSQSLS